MLHLRTQVRFQGVTYLLFVELIKIHYYVKYREHELHKVEVVEMHSYRQRDAKYLFH